MNSYFPLCLIVRRKDTFKTQKFIQRGRISLPKDKYVEGDLSVTNIDSVDRMVETDEEEMVRNIVGLANRKAVVKVKVVNHRRPGVFQY